MKNIVFMFALAGILTPFILSAQSAKGNVAIIYNGVNGVNKEAVNHIRKEAPHLGYDYTFKPVKAGSDVKTDDYIAVVILNTNREAGIDPVLSDFINKQQDKSRMILVSLKKGSRDFMVEKVLDSPEIGGVDAISASSLWKSFGHTSEIRAMHEEWLTEVLTFIQESNS